MGTIELTCSLDNVLRRLEERKRADDDIATAKRRYESHKDDTIPVIDKYLSKLDPPVRKVCSAENCWIFTNKDQVDSNQDGVGGWLIFSEVLRVSYCLAVRGVRSDRSTEDLGNAAVATTSWCPLIAKPCCYFR